MAEEIKDIAEGLRTTARDKLDKIIEYAKAIKSRVDEKITEAFQEIARTEIE